MPVVESDLEYRLSGGANNESPAASLGGAMSTKAAGVITTEELENIFDVVLGDEGKAGDTEYRAIYLKNKHGSISLLNAKLWITQDADSEDDTTAIALADEGVNEAVETIANENTAPSGPTFSAPTTKGAGLNLGTIPAGQFRGFWIRRTISAEADANNKITFKIRAEGETGA
jgi:hypothetical protein